MQPRTTSLDFMYKSLLSPIGVKNERIGLLRKIT